MTDFYGRQGRNFAQDHSKDSVCKPDYQGYCPCPLEEAPTDVAELICSDHATDKAGMHAPVIDIDFAAQLLPSATPGHFHLYLDKPCSWQEYLDVLKAMAKAGLVQWGFVNTTEERGYGSLRHPDRPKEIAE